MPIQVTPSAVSGSAVEARWRRIASIPGFVGVERAAVDWSQPVLLVGRARLFVRLEGQDFGWHRGLWHTRIEAGDRHPLIRALGAAATVLDTTLGFGTDAAFVRSWLGARVFGVEASPLLALLAAEGLRSQVPVVCADARTFLAGLRPGAVDAIVADPLFTEVRGVSTSFDLVRRFGVRAGIDAAWLAEARRVARRVVVKDATKGTLLEELGVEHVVDSPRTRYGVWTG
jgi:hypothetical protein